mmetsp:Transcript_48800/g.96646  ORF Transcript_48800/g.96646 Transcript_48800/m.96646 type:complete len:82 (+) Transcript_48800:151-396(+)
MGVRTVSCESERAGLFCWLGRPGSAGSSRNPGQFCRGSTNGTAMGIFRRGLGGEKRQKEEVMGSHDEKVRASFFSTFFNHH